jgi:hypothetical protein
MGHQGRGGVGQRVACHLVSAIVGVVLSMTGLASALPLGPFQITPELILEERYDSNIFLEPTDERDDFISYGAFNMKLALPIRLTRARTISPFVNVFADAAAFAKNPEENFQNAGITGGLDVDMPLVRPDQRLTFNLSNQFRSVTEVSSSAEQSDIGPRTQRTENFLNADLGYFLTRRDEFHVFYNRLDLRQENVAQFLDRNENTVGLTYFHQLRPLFSGLIEYNYQFTDFTNLGPTDPDFSSTGHILAIGFRREAAARLSGTIKVGAELRELERGSSVVEPFVSSLVTFRITPRQITNLTLTRSTEESSNQDFSFFNATTVNLRLTQELSAKISAFLEGRFELDEFEERVIPGDPATRQDRLYGVGGGVNYQFAHWLTTGLSYQYRTKNSNVQILDYVDHVAILWFTFAF